MQTRTKVIQTLSANTGITRRDISNVSVAWRAVELVAQLPPTRVRIDLKPRATRGETADGGLPRATLQQPLFYSPRKFQVVGIMEYNKKLDQLKFISSFLSCTKAACLYRYIQVCNVWQVTVSL